MNKHNPNRVAVAVLVAGAALAGIMVQGAEDSGRDAPVLTEIPSDLEVSPGEGEVLRAYNVSGMCCTSCTRRLHDTILGMEGIEACAVDLNEEQVHLIAKGNVPPAEILLKLNFDKYSAIELPLGP